jgi:hypothetical protein
MTGDQVGIHYPLSNADSALAVLAILALYTLPLIVLLFTRFRVASRLAGMAVVLAGLYLNTYAAAIVAIHLMVGWYTYTLGAIAYLVVSSIQLWQGRRPGP